MPVRHDDDPRNGRPQIDGHNVTEYEVEAVTGSSNGRPVPERGSENRDRGDREPDGALQRDEEALVNMGGFRRTKAENSRLGAWPRGVPRLSIVVSGATRSCTGVSGLIMVGSLRQGNQGGYNRLHDKRNHSVSA